MIYGKGEELPKIHLVNRDMALRWVNEAEASEDKELVNLHKLFLDGKITDDEYITRKGRRLKAIDPSAPHRRGPTMHRQSTKVDYVDGRHFWGKAKNDKGPGANWVGGMGYLEAQLYNMG